MEWPAAYDPTCERVPPRQPSYSIVYVWPDGRREVRYTRPGSDQRLADEVRRLQLRDGDKCPYVIE